MGVLCLGVRVGWGVVGWGVGWLYVLRTWVPLTLNVPGHLGVIQCTCVKLIGNSETAHRRVRGREIWVSCVWAGGGGGIPFLVRT